MADTSGTPRPLKGSSKRDHYRQFMDVFVNYTSCQPNVACHKSFKLYIIHRSVLFSQRTMENGKVPQAKDEEVARQKWSGKLDFVLSCISFAVGFGNIWRFPYMCYKNGGAVFLIPYILMLVLVGFPLFYMELCLGQFSGKGPVKVWAVVPVMRGVGYAMVLNSFFKASYYVILVAYTFYYFFASLSSTLPWSNCRQGIGIWATPGCYSTVDDTFCKNINENFSYVDNTCINRSSPEYLSLTNNTKHTTPGEDYFKNNVLQLSPDMYHMNGISWQLSLCLLLSWIVIYLCMIKGTKSFGKVSYFTAIFPYIILTILLVKGATLPGSSKGVLFYVIPDFSKLTEIRVWFDAASQVFYSLGCGVGCLITFASFNEFNKPNKVDALVTAIVNSLTSLYAGFAIFSILGFLADDAQVDVKDVATDGSGLVFMAYPQALSRMPLSPVWAVMFFIMLLTLGIGSLFGPVEVVMTAIQDLFPALRKRYKILLVAVVSVLYIFGLCMVTDIGPYIFTVLNAYNGYSMVLVGIVELVSISYIYGIKKFIEDVEFMLNAKLGIYFKVTWAVTAPIITLAVVIFSFAMYKPVSYGKTTLPPWINGIGWMIVAIANSPIVIFAFIEIYSKTERLLLEGKIHGRRGRGRPRTAWYHNIKEWTGMRYADCARKAQNREEWRSITANLLKADGTKDRLDLVILKLLLSIF
ncbi:Sodium- and chloride-dependent glycine transporter 2 [Nymphon striatum]|nr:Sodium- and chloride-dependent glycine transporter 2 [Nymphon striatum]